MLYFYILSIDEYDKQSHYVRVVDVVKGTYNLMEQKKDATFLTDFELMDLVAKSLGLIEYHICALRKEIT